MIDEGLVMKLAVPCATLWLLFAATPAAAQMKVLRLDYVEVRDTKSAQGQQLRSVMTFTVLRAPDGRQRTEKIDPDLSLHIVEVFDFVRDVHIRMDMKRKIAVRQRGQAARFEQLRAQVGTTPKQELGTRIMQGFECHGSRYVDQSAEAWVCRDPGSALPFFGSVSAQSPTGGIFRMDLQRVTRDFDVDPSIFEIPVGFRIIDQ